MTVLWLVTVNKTLLKQQFHRCLCQTMPETLDFGKHRNKTLSEVPIKYVLFLAGFELEGTRKIKNELSASTWISNNKPKVRQLAIEFLRGKCWKCGGKLIPIGTSRRNGACHDDWEERILHKQCWKLIKAEEEEAEECSEDQSSD